LQTLSVYQPVIIFRNIKIKKRQNITSIKDGYFFKKEKGVNVNNKNEC